MGVFLRPKDTNRIGGDNTKLTAEVIGVVSDYDNEYIPNDGTFDSDTDGKSGGRHNRDPIRREAPAGSPLPGGSWRGAVSKNVSSGFGKGTRAGKSRR